MKRVKFLLLAFVSVVAFSATAQDDFSDPRFAKWGETPEQRKANILASQYLKEETQNRHFGEAARNLQLLLQNCPAASENIYVNGVKLYKDKVNRAESIAERNVYVDSILYLYDVRMEHFANHPKRGRVYLLERKARELLTYRPSDREGVRELFEEVIAAQAAINSVDPEVVAIYFKNLCDDYAQDLVDAMQIVTAYDENAKYFENISEEAMPFKAQFEDCFSMSGAASCENLEAIFSKKLEADPNNVDLLSKTFALLFKASCTSPFAINVAERLYVAQPSADIAMHLAKTFQDQKNFDGASKYLREALAVEQDVAKRESLLIRIGMLEMTQNDFAQAVEAFRQVQEIDEDDPHALFFLAQCYVSGAKGASGMQRDAVYWVAYDLLKEAIPLLEAEDPERVDAARELMAAYRAAWPTAEECFFQELKEGSQYIVNCGFVHGVATRVRPREQ